jgi:hypothetical protein
MRLRRHPAEDSLFLRGAVLSTVLVAVGAVAVQEEFTAQAAVAAAAIILGSWVSHVRRRASNWMLKSAIAVLVLIVARDFFISLLANPYDPRIPLVRLFLWLQALHSFDLPARKDLKYSLISAVVLMTVAAVYTRELIFGLFLAVFALCGSATLVVLAAEDRVRVQPRVVLSLGAILAGGVLVSSGLVFAAIPHRPGLRVQWLPVSPRFALARRIYDRILNPAYPQAGDRPGVEPPPFDPTGYIGFSSSVDLRLRGVLDQTVVMRVRATRPAFWRGLAFDEYTGVGWAIVRSKNTRPLSRASCRALDPTIPGPPARRRSCRRSTWRPSSRTSSLRPTAPLRCTSPPGASASTAMPDCAVLLRLSRD